MPEGPELLHSRDVLRRTIVNKRLRTFGVIRGRYEKKPPDGLECFDQSLLRSPYRIESVDVKGKFMWWTVESPVDVTWYVWTTYGMSGRWHVGRELISADKHLAAVAVFDDESVARFYDARHFGTLKFVDDPKQHQRKLSSLGPDMLSAPPDAAGFLARLHRCPTKTIAQALMNQTIVSGVGNYIKAEALYRAKISPHRKVGDLLTSEAGALRQAIIDVMQEAYRAKGATLRSYRTADGESGAAQFKLQVYGRPSDPNGRPVIKEVTADKRTTHWVPDVQK